MKSVGQKDTYCMISRICEISYSPTHRSRVEWWFSKAGRKRKWGDVQGVQGFGYARSVSVEDTVYISGTIINTEWYT